MKIGVLEFLSDQLSESWGTRLIRSRYLRHLSSITPQAVAVWCRELGHQVYYATFYGQCPPERLLPVGLDIVFVSAHTQASTLAYALAKLCRREKTLTVIGGPHARCYPRDCLRFFDLVVDKCDKALIEDILGGRFDRPSFISSGRVLDEIPSVQAREPEIVAASFKKNGRPRAFSNVPLLSSVGCPYTCDFCVDWNSTYEVIPKDHLEVDLRFVSARMPGVLVTYHDPNFGIRFDEVLDVIEQIPKALRNPYIVESSLSVLRDSRLTRLRESNCVGLTAGIESWGNYSNKAGVGSMTGREKLARIVVHFEKLHYYFPVMQGNFIFGTDVDEGDEPVELTKEFIHRLPWVWPSISIPVPFAGTPLFDNYLAEGRILKSLPFSFHYAPYLVSILKNYHVQEYYERLIDICSAAASGKMLARRLRGRNGHGFSGRQRWAMKEFYILRTLDVRLCLLQLRQILRTLKSDPHLRAFHEGRSDRLPDFYRHRHLQVLGGYAELFSEAEWRPDLGPPPRPLGGSTPSDHRSSGHCQVEASSATTGG